MPTLDDRSRHGEASLAEFLRSRRGRLSPEAAGLPHGRRRRTPGLRREEVADLAGIGASWYTALEQGRDVRPSDDLLNNLARALRLSAAETTHLFLLAGRPAPNPPPPLPVEVAPALLRLLDIVQPYPAFVSNRRWDWLAWNRAADVLFGFDPEQRCLPRNALRQFFFQSPFSPEAEWERSARSIVARFRAQTVQSTHEPWFDTFVADLCRLSDAFSRIWQRHEVEDAAEPAHTMYHPRAGLVQAELVVLGTPAMPGARLVTVLLEPGVADQLGLAAD